MGDRALIIFQHATEVSPTVYVHWAGHVIPKLLRQHKELMKGRFGDIEYACARFIGILHNSTNPGDNLGLGVWNTPEVIQKCIKEKKFERPSFKDYSHGDAGIILVDCADFSVQAFHGYLKELSPKDWEDSEKDI